MSINSKLKLGTIVEFKGSEGYTLGIIDKVDHASYNPYKVKWMSHDGSFTSCKGLHLTVIAKPSKLVSLLFKE